MLPFEPSWSRGVYHLFVVRTGDREGLMNHLKDAGIGTGIHYPIPLHLQNAYASSNYNLGDFPVTEKVSAEIVSLPMFPQLSKEQQERVIGEIVAFGAKKTGARSGKEEKVLASAGSCTPVAID